MNVTAINLLKSAKCLSFNRTMSVLSEYLKYSEYGDPKLVVRKYEEKLADPKSGEILVKLLVAPINPADINTLQGKYPDRPTLPAVPGNEGVAEVLKCGPDTTQLVPGDIVIPFKSHIGTWRTTAILNEKDLMKVPKDIGLADAATLTVNPPTAYRMLKDYVRLKEGDTVIQNGANSAVGQAVFQLCKIWGYNCVGVVRDRPDLKRLSDFLKGLGATEVLTEEEIRTTQLFKSGKLPKPKLAFNCVGGKSATEILRQLDDKGVLVTYGAMSREPVTAPNAALIFKDISFKGFWMSRWTKENFHSDKRLQMFRELIEIIQAGKLKVAAHKMVSFDDYEAVLAGALDLKGFAGDKLIFDFTNKKAKL